MRLSRAPTPTATAKPSPGAGSARPALRQSRSGRGSIHGKCAAPIRCATRPSRRSNSMRRARISAPRSDFLLYPASPCSKKSERGQASYYFSQPYFKVSGRITIDDRPAEVTGLAWMDREWSSQPLASDQTGWDWFSLHLTSGEKLMLYRLRQNDGHNNLFGNWIEPDGRSI